jgi:hypothetical protein
MGAEPLPHRERPSRETAPAPNRPQASHVVVHQTARPITIHADPSCLVPTVPFQKVEPACGTHVSAVGSFKA